MCALVSVYAKMHECACTFAFADCTHGDRKLACVAGGPGGTGGGLSAETSDFTPN